MIEKPLTQEEIRFQLAASRHACGWWSKSPYKSFGSIMHWLYVYSNLNIAESVIIGDGEAKLNGKLYATYTFDEALQLPIFDFQNQETDEILFQKAYLKGLREKWENPYEQVSKKA